MLKTLRPRLTELGKIKIGGKGEKKQSSTGGKDWRLPVKHSYFTITGSERDAAGDLKPDAGLMAALLEKYGVDDGGKRRLREIPIALLSDNVDELLVARYCRYEGRVLHATCDGETETWVYGRNGKLAQPATRPCSGKHDKPWKLHATFHCVIAEGGARWGGVYKFRTTSEISTEQLLGGMQQVQALTGGILQGVPLRLVVRGIEVAPDGVATTVYVVHVELRGTDLSHVQQQALQAAQMRISHAKQLTEVRQQYLALLAAPESVEEQADIAEEFHAGEENAEASAAVVDVVPLPALPAAEVPAAEVKAKPARRTKTANAPAAPPVISDSTVQALKDLEARSEPVTAAVRNNNLHSWRNPPDDVVRAELVSSEGGPSIDDFDDVPF